MEITQAVRQVLSWYAHENIGVKTNLVRILMHGALAGTGRMVILPVDQGFEHGPDRSFGMNLEAYDPDYHFQVATRAGLSAYAAPLGMLEFAADKFTGQVPLILKLNSAISLLSKNLSPTQAMTSSVEDALRLGCSAVGVTIYPGSDDFYNAIDEIREIILEAKSCGLAVVVWSYPRGEGVSKEGETAIDVCSYAGHIAAVIGANIIKLKPPSNFIEKSENLKIYQENHIQTGTLVQRISQVMKSIFNGKRLVVFSGLAKRSDQDLLAEIAMIKEAGASGSIIGRNIFQRPFNKSIELLQKVCQIYRADV
jgi:class I fructose-bisphosphate aldolase